MNIRRLAPTDSMADLTAMIHRAYARLAAAGLRFVATTQDEATTRHRCAGGECWVAVRDGAIVGTITWSVGVVKKDDPWHYSQPGWAVFEQFAVEPSLQRAGLGGRLLALAEERATGAGCTHMACDTAEPAKHLIAYYEKRGYAIVGGHQWSMVNYASVVLGKRLSTRR